jgi:hypothetical protein
VSKIGGSIELLNRDSEIMRQSLRDSIGFGSVFLEILWLDVLINSRSFPSPLLFGIGFCQNFMPANVCQRTGCPLFRIHTGSSVQVCKTNSIAHAFDAEMLGRLVSAGFFIFFLILQRVVRLGGSGLVKD